MDNVVSIKKKLTADTDSGKIAGEGPGVDATGAEAAATLAEWAELARARRAKQAEQRAKDNRSVARSYRLPTGETKK
jgi:hypothetical protein